MALASELPIYAKAYELLMLVAQLTQQYPRNYRQVLAREILSESQGLVTTVFRANCTFDKIPFIERLREQLETLRLLLKLSKDLRLISAGQFGATVVLTEAVSKQATGWLKHYRKSA